MPTKSRTSFFVQFKPKKMDWYILSEILGPFMGGCVFFIFIFLTFQALRLAEFFIIHGVPLITLLKLTALMGMSFLPTALPVAFLIAVLVGFGRLSSDSELVAMKSSGFSLGRISLPVTALSLVVVVMSIFLNKDWVPWSETAFKKMLIRVSNTKVVSSLHEGTFTSGFFDLLIFADKIDTRTNHLSKVFIYDEREPRNPLTVVAGEGEILSVKTDSELASAAMLKLYNGSIHRNDIEGKTYQKINFGEYRLFLKIDEGADTATIKPHMIPSADLDNKIRDNPITTYAGREFRGEYWRRYAMAFSPLVFVFLGIGWASFQSRTARAGAVLTAFIIFIIYWGIQTYATTALQRGTLSPFFAMQLPNFVAMVGAIYGFRKAGW